MARYRTPTPFTPQYPEKYKGEYPILSRSSWEWDFMVYCDQHPGVLEWASEPVQIPYRDPLTGNQKIYIPDFLITVVNKSRELKKKLIEIKPMHEQLSEHARNSADAALQARNRAKWGAAITWCARRGIEFDVMNEASMFNGHDNKKGRVHPVREYAPAQTKKVALKGPRQPKKRQKSLAEKTNKIAQVRKRVGKVKSRRTPRVGKVSKA